MADRIQQRRDTAARWTQFNPILLEGEVGYELDTDQYKVGNGVNAWNDLPYRGDPCVQQLGTSTTTPISQDAISKIIGVSVAYAMLNNANVDTAEQKFTWGSGLIILSGMRYRQFTDSTVQTAEMEYGASGAGWNGLIWLIWDDTERKCRLIKYNALQTGGNVFQEKNWFVIGAWYGAASSASAIACLCLNSNSITVDGKYINNTVKLNADVQLLSDSISAKVSKNQFTNPYFNQWANTSGAYDYLQTDKVTDPNAGAGAGAGALTYIHTEITKSMPKTSGSGDYTVCSQLMSTAWDGSFTCGPAGSGAFFETGDVAMLEITYRTTCVDNAGMIRFNYSNRFPYVSLPSTNGEWKTIVLPLTIIVPTGMTKTNIHVCLNRNLYDLTAGQFIDVAKLQIMNMKYPWEFQIDDYRLFSSDTVLIDKDNKIHTVDLLGNKFIGADASILATDAWTPVQNSVFSDVFEGGKKWYNLAPEVLGQVSTNTGWIGGSLSNLYKTGAVISRNLEDNNFHVGDTVYFKVRVKGTLPVTLILEYLNPNNGAYLARATADSQAPAAVLGDGTKEVVIMATKTINDFPSAASAFETCPMAFCMQFAASSAVEGAFLQIREITVSKTPFAEDSVVLSTLDADFYKQEEEDEEMGQSSAAPTQEMGNDDFIRPTADINTIIAYGQSNGSGQQTAPSLSIDNFRGNLQVGVQEWWDYGQVASDRNTFNPLKAYPAKTYGKTPEESKEADISDQMLCESQAINFANAAKNLLDKVALGLFDRKYLDMNFSLGGRSIESLSKGYPANDGAAYKTVIAGVTKAKELADADSKSINVGVITWIQGEYNSTQSANQGWEPGTPATNDPEQYKAYLKQLVTDLRNDIKPITGQTENPLFICTQPGTGWLREFQMYIWMALLEASQEDNRIVMACPVYMVTNRGHLDPNGQRWVGEFFAKVYYKTIIKGQVWKPLQPKRIIKGKNNIIIDFFVPAPPLRFDQNTVKPVSNYGFVIRNNGTNVAISSVKLISATQVEITCASDFTGYVEIGYASYGTAYGNLCDSDNWRAFSTYQELPAQLKPTASGGNGWEPKGEDGLPIYNKPYPCQNFSVQFYYKLEQSENEKIINI